LDFEYPDQRSVDGKKFNFEDWQLFEGPFVNSKKGRKIIEIQYKQEKVVLDFNDFSIWIK
jgi:hypothetical protein